MLIGLCTFFIIIIMVIITLMFITITILILMIVTSFAIDIVGGGDERTPGLHHSP